MIGLSLAYLKDRGLNTALNILLLALSVASLVILLLFSSQLENRFDKDAQGIDMVVGAKGSPLQLILSSVYHVDIPTGNVPLDTVPLLRRQLGVAEAIPLALGDSFRSFRIVGTEPAYPALLEPIPSLSTMHPSPLQTPRRAPNSGRSLMAQSAGRCALALMLGGFLGGCGTTSSGGGLLDKTLGLVGLQTVDSAAAAPISPELLKPAAPTKMPLRIHASDQLNSDGAIKG